MNNRSKVAELCALRDGVDQSIANLGGLTADRCTSIGEMTSIGLTLKLLRDRVSRAIDALETTSEDLPG